MTKPTEVDVKAPAQCCATFRDGDEAFVVIANFEPGQDPKLYLMRAPYEEWAKGEVMFQQVDPMPAT